jgi:hypothetical protein
MVDHLTTWVKPLPLSSATANGVVKILLDNIIPRFGFTEDIDSHRGSHFTANVIRELVRALAISWEWECHTPWHPSSSGRVERMNQTLKRQLTKPVLETRAKCLPPAFLRIRTSPQEDIGISPYEM